MTDKEKHIDVTASSLVDLKAELLRKQEEFRQQKLQNATHRSLTVPKKPNIWSRKNAGVLERAQNDLEQKTEETDAMEKARAALEAKARLYDQMSHGDTISDEDGSKRFLVDFEQKNLTVQAERRKLQQQTADAGETDQQKQSREEDEELVLDTEEPMPDNADEQWVDYVDSFGRSRRCLRKDLADMVEQKASNTDKVPDLMSADMKRELQRQEWEREAEEALSRPVGPVHYADVRYNEIRDHGVGFFEFSKDEETRRQQLEALKKLRQQTDEQRAKSEAVKEKRKALLEARLAKVRQRKTIHAVPDLDLDVTSTEDDVGPKLSEVMPPEPLVRDESLRKTGSVREWDKGKTPVHDEESWLSTRRDERLAEFAPPQIYATDSASFPPQQRQRSAIHVNERPQKRSLFGSKLQPQSDSMSTTAVASSSPANNIAAVLRSIRSDVEQSQLARGDNHDTVGNRCLEEESNASVGFLTPVTTVGVHVPVVDNNGHSYNQMTATSLSLDFIASAGSTPEQFCGTFPATWSSNDTPSVVSTAPFTMPEADNATGCSDVCSDSSGPQPAHYSSAPAGPQAKQPKYERVFLHDLPPALPLPPVAGSTGEQYPSQEEVIGPKRRKESHELNEKNAIRSWYRQFDQKRTKPVVQASDSRLDPVSKSQLLKPKNIPFASPYIQTNDASAEVKDDPAVREFDPSKPPPSVTSNVT